MVVDVCRGAVSRAVMSFIVPSARTPMRPMEAWESKHGHPVRANMPTGSVCLSVDTEPGSDPKLQRKRPSSLIQRSWLATWQLGPWRKCGAGSAARVRCGAMRRSLHGTKPRSPYLQPSHLGVIWGGGGSEGVGRRGGSPLLFARGHIQVPVQPAVVVAVAASWMGCRHGGRLVGQSAVCHE